MSFIERFKKATFGFAGYPDLARDKAGGYGFLALVLLAAMAFSMVVSTYRAQTAIGEAKVALQNGPDFGLKNGEVYFTGQQPYVVSDGDQVIIIDTTGKTTKEALEGKRNNSLLITRDTVYDKQAMGGIRETKLSAFSTFSLTKNDIINLMGALVWLIPVGYLFLYAFQLGVKALDALVLVIAAKVYGIAAKKEVPFGLGFKMGIYALTIPILLQWIVPEFPYKTWAFWGLAILFTIMGTKAYFDTPDDPAEAIPTGTN